MSDTPAVTPKEHVQAAYAHLDAVIQAWQAYRAASTAPQPRDDQTIFCLRKTLNDCIDQAQPFANAALDALAVEYLRAVGVQPGEFGAQLPDDLDKLPRDDGGDECLRRIEERRNNLAEIALLLEIPPCYGCDTAAPPKYLTLPTLVCPACGEWELHTGIGVMPLSGPGRPTIQYLESPLWRPMAPVTKQADDLSPVEPIAPGPPARDWQAVSAALGDETVGAMIRIAQGASTVDQKMREIYTLDNRCLAWDSPTWANLLGVSDAAVRKTDWWKNERPRLRG